MIEYIVIACVAALGVAAAIASAVVRHSRLSVSERQLELVVNVAAVWAGTRGDAEIAPEHFLGAALYDPHAAVRHAGSVAGANWLRGAIAEHLSAAPRRTEETPLGASPRLTHAIAVARQRAGGLRVIDEAIGEIVAEPSATIAGLLSTARGIREASVAKPDISPLAGSVYRARHAPTLVPVVFWNDARTKMGLVMKIFQDVFSLSYIEAVYFTLSVHHVGRAVVGKYEAARAERLVADALTIVRAEGAPLRITVGEPRDSWLRRLADRVGAASSRAAIFVLAVACLALSLPYTGCRRRDAPSHAQTLPEARKGFVTKYTNPAEPDDPPAEPPPAVLSIVHYPSAVGPLAAYLSARPPDAERHPAIVWIVGGLDNGIGDTAWVPADWSDDQSARAFREAGIVLMLPSLRGGVGNPGKREMFFGEVDDVIAAGEYVRTLDYVDPERVYLGGHSTGGTLVLLVAESTTRFRTIFSLSPVADVASYGDALGLDDEQELRLRSPVNFEGAIQTPTWVLEGTAPPSNVGELPDIAAAAKGVPLHALRVPGVTHFSVVAPVTTLLAQKIVTDKGPTPSISLSSAELAQSVRAGHAAP